MTTATEQTSRPEPLVAPKVADRLKRLNLAALLEHSQRGERAMAEAGAELLRKIAKANRRARNEARDRERAELLAPLSDGDE